MCPVARRLDGDPRRIEAGRQGAAGGERCDFAGDALLEVTEQVHENPRLHVEQSPVLVGGEAIRHTGDVVGDDARPLRRGGVVGPPPPFGGQALWFGDEQLKQVPHQPSRLAGHPIELVVPVHVLPQEPLQRPIVRLHFRGEGHDRPAAVADGVRRVRPNLLDPPSGFDDQVVDHVADQPAHELVDQPRCLDPRVAVAHAREYRPDERHLAQVVDAEQTGAHAVVDVVIVVGDVVGERGDLRLGAGVRREFQVVAADVLADRPRQRPAGALARERAVVLDHALQRFPGQVQAVELGVTLLQLGDHAQTLRVVVEAAERLHHLLQRVLAGMAERRMSEVVGEGERFRQILVETQRPTDRARDLRDLEAVRQPGAEEVALVVDEHLRLVLQPTEGRGVDDPVAIALKAGARGALRLGMQPPAAVLGLARPRGEVIGGRHAEKVQTGFARGNRVAKSGGAGPRFPCSPRVAGRSRDRGARARLTT